MKKMDEFVLLEKDGKNLKSSIVRIVAFNRKRFEKEILHGERKKVALAIERNDFDIRTDGELLHEVMERMFLKSTRGLFESSKAINMQKSVNVLNKILGCEALKLEDSLVIFNFAVKNNQMELAKQAQEVIKRSSNVDIYKSMISLAVDAQLEDLVISGLTNRNKDIEISQEMNFKIISYAQTSPKNNEIITALEQINSSVINFENIPENEVFNGIGLE